MKFINLTLLSLFALGIMFTACSDNMGTEHQLTAETEINSVDGHLLLPSDIMQKDESAIDEYVASLSNVDFIAHQNAYIIMKYLEELGLKNQYADYIIAGNFKDANLSDQLDKTQIDALEKNLFTVNENTGEAEFRGWCCKYIYMDYCWAQPDLTIMCCCGDYFRVCGYYCSTPGGPQ